MSTDAPSTMTASSPIPAPLPAHLELCHHMIAELLAALHGSQRREEQLQQRLHLLLKKMYGPRSEHLDPAQLLLFAEALADAQAETASAPPPVEPSAVEPPAADRAASPPKRGHGRRPLPADLTRIPLVHDLTAAEKGCPDCGTPRQKIGEERTEQLDYHPAHLFVVEHIRPKYACLECQGQVTAAVKPAQPLGGGLPGPGLLAYVITSKYFDHLPLYRLERILARHGVDLARSTLCDWLAAAAVLVRPLLDLMTERMLQSQVVHTDDTPVPVQDPGAGRTKTGRLWVYLGDRDHPYTVFAYTPTRKRDGPATFLKNYQGYLQADAFGGYDGIYASGRVTEVGCHAHARRKFFEAKDTDPARALHALAVYRQLYDIEASRKDGDDATRLRARQEQAVPLLTAYRHWLQNEQAAVLPKSPLGQAITYTLNQWQALLRYTTAGCLAIDNNVAEREMKRIAIGRKNWLFAGSDKGGATAATLFSLTSSCHRHGLDPHLYLRDVLVRLPGLPRERLPELLPDRWQQTQAAASPPSQPRPTPPP